MVTTAVRKGELYWVDFGPINSSAPAKRRPAAVVQADDFNQSRLATVIVAAITSNTGLASYPGNVFLPAAVVGLPRDSVLNVTVLATVDRRDLIERIGELPNHLVAELNLGLGLVLDL
jgi:mRNA interferase MazF